MCCSPGEASSSTRRRTARHFLGVVRLLRRREDRFLQHVREGTFASFIAIANAAGQSLVAAMFAPRLGDRLQLGIGRVAAQFAKMPLDRLHLDERQIELSFAAQTLQPGVVERQQRDGASFKPIRRADMETFQTQRSVHHLLDRIVRQNFGA